MTTDRPITDAVTDDDAGQDSNSGVGEESANAATEPSANRDSPSDASSSKDAVVERSESSAPERSESSAPERSESSAPERSESDNAALLEREGDIAADYLEVLLDIADLDGDIDIDVEGDRAAVSVVGPGLDRLIGTGGGTLDALQELTRLAVHRETGVRSRLMLDVGGHRAQRREELSALGAAAARRVADSGEAERLAPMTPFERKIVHDAVATVDGVETESEGEEPDRRVVIRPV